MAMKRICRIEFENFRGITESKIDVPRNGLRLQGDEGTGKTSHLDGIASSLRRLGLGVEAIRRGAEKASTLLVLDDGTKVARSASREKGIGDVSVRIDGARAGQKWLDERLGLAAFDVISFISAKPSDRVRMLQEAVPCTVTLEQLRTWVPSLEAFDCSGHGLDVVRKLHKIAYDKRTAANAAAKVANAEHERTALEATRAAEGVDPSALGPADALDLQRVAERHASTLLAAVKEAKAHEARTAGTREQIAKIREQADLCAVTENDWAAAGVKVDSEQIAVNACFDRVAELEAHLVKARAALADAKKRHADAQHAFATIETRRAEADKLRARAAELEATLAATAPEAPSDEALAAADAAVAEAYAALDAAERAEAARAAVAKRDDAAAKAKAANAEATRLDAIVKALANDAPRALMAEQGGIEGLEIDGETIRVDGVSIDSLSSGEQLRLSVRLAKKLNKVQILIVDHLEHLAPKRRDAFLREACSGDWQVFATETTDDDQLVIVGLDFDDEAQAAE